MRVTKKKSARTVCRDTGKPYVRPKSWRNKISESKKLYYKNHPDETPWTGKKNPMYGTCRCGKDNPNFGKKWSSEKKKEFSKYQSENSSWLGKRHTEKTRRKMVESAKRVTKTEVWRKRMRQSALKRAKEQGGVSYNPHACKYFDELNKKKSWNLKHALNGGEIECVGYSLDAYDKKRNIVVEYDEPHHYTIRGKLKRKDVRRQNRIIGELHCKFYRFNEREKKFYKVL
jgi:hypothetical protein